MITANAVRLPRTGPTTVEHVFARLLRGGPSAPPVTQIGGGVPVSDAEQLSVDDRSRDRFDLMLLAPDTTELSRRDWLSRAVQALNRVLPADGVAYALIPRRARPRFLHLASRCGLRPGPAFVHLTHGSSEYVVRCDAPSMRLLAKTLPMSRLKSRLIVSGAVVPRAPDGLWLTAPRSGIVLQRAGAAEPGRWMSDAAVNQAIPHIAMVRVKLRASTGTAVTWLCRPGADRACTLIKSAVDASSQSRVEHELAALEQMASGAAAAGARLPTFDRIAGEPAAVRFVSVGGTPADAALAAEPSSRDEVVRQVARWLQCWNARTAVERVIDAEWIETEVLSPARTLAPMVADASSYLAALTWLCARVRGCAVRLVATHGDLTMSNVLLQRSAPIGIVDWEAARNAGLPLSDLYYAAADALLAAHRDGDRERALIESFDPGTAYGAFVSGLARKSDPAAAEDPAWSELLLHATALHHAANERQKDRRGRQPFAGLLNHLAARLTRL